MLVHSVAEARRELPALSGPFAVKLQSPQMLHKSGSGGIVLGIPDASSAALTVGEMLELAERNQLSCEGVLVEEMLSVQFEFLVGLRRDPALGPVLMIGRGGISVEVDPDVTRAFLPVSHEDVLGMFERLRSSRLYAGFRGKQAAPLAELARVICSIADLFQDDDSLSELEINPLVSDGSGNVMALDATVWRVV
jgi:succinyl-CoA synthetase beta subunit